VRAFLGFTLFTAVVSCGGSADPASPESTPRTFCKADATGVELVHPLKFHVVRYAGVVAGAHRRNTQESNAARLTSRTSGP
jgi:hypothetical protein